MTTSLRTLHLLDLENLLGDPRAGADRALATFAEYLDVARWQPGDHVVVASNPGLMAKVVFDLPVPASAHTARGPDGADLMLLSLAPPELVATRYQRLVVGSGDGIFAARTHTARERGVVEVVARHGGCSRRLRAFRCTYLASDAPDASAVVLAA